MEIRDTDPNILLENGAILHGFQANFDLYKTFSVAASRGLFFANAGGVLALLTFLGQVWARGDVPKETVDAFRAAFTWLAVGLTTNLFSTFSAWFACYYTIEHLHAASINRFLRTRARIVEAMRSDNATEEVVNGIVAEECKSRLAGSRGREVGICAAVLFTVISTVSFVAGCFAALSGIALGS